MARDFDGVNDQIAFGSNASIDDFGATGITMAFWVEPDATGFISFFCKDRETNWILWEATQWQFRHQWSTFPGVWRATATVPTTLHHLVVTYDGGNVANDATFTIDGVAETVVDIRTPEGTISTDAAQNLLLGEDGASSDTDFNGRVGWMSYDNAIWSAADINRHRWWGTAPGGPSTVDVSHPLWTSGLGNNGTATADGTVSGTTMASMPVVERMWGSSMGCGR